jgi:hypothetical protein
MSYILRSIRHWAMLVVLISPAAILRADASVTSTAISVATVTVGQKLSEISQTANRVLADLRRLNREAADTWEGVIARSIALLNQELRLVANETFDQIDTQRKAMVNDIENMIYLISNSISGIQRSADVSLIHNVQEIGGFVGAIPRLILVFVENDRLFRPLSGEDRRAARIVLNGVNLNRFGRIRGRLAYNDQFLTNLEFIQSGERQFEANINRNSLPNASISELQYTLDLEIYRSRSTTRVGYALGLSDSLFGPASETRRIVIHSSSPYASALHAGIFLTRHVRVPAPTLEIPRAWSLSGNNSFTENWDVAVGADGQSNLRFISDLAVVTDCSNGARFPDICRRHFSSPGKGSTRAIVIGRSSENRRVLTSCNNNDGCHFRAVIHAPREILDEEQSGIIPLSQMLINHGESITFEISNLLQNQNTRRRVFINVTTSSSTDRFEFELHPRRCPPQMINQRELTVARHRLSCTMTSVGALQFTVRAPPQIPQ